jgi:DNA-binding NarL/FixJ family response regulator
MKSCLVCDDHAMMRMALSGAVTMAWPNAQVITAQNFDEAKAAAEARPDLILCDLSMPGATPLEGIKSVLAAAPATPVLVITGNENDALLLALFDLGIAGFVAKSESAEVIEAAMRIVVAGSRYVPPRVIGLVSSRGAGSPDPAMMEALGASRLSGRQIEVLRLMARGEGNKDIARLLNLSPATVKTHVASVLSALHCINRTEAVFRARELGLI